MKKPLMGARVRTLGVSCLTIAALVFSVSANIGVTRAATRTHAMQANVLEDVLAAKTLWAGTLDPAQISALTDADVVSKIYAGLVKQAFNDKTHKFDIVPDLAAGMPMISKDGLTYTFKIRPDAMFSDGTPVTAQDFVYSFTRVLNPKANSPVSYYLYALAGAAAYNSGKANKLTSVKALDDHTLQLTLAQPASWFLYALSYQTGYVVKPDLAYNAPVTTNPALVIGAGPWMLKGGTWSYRHQISLVPNPHYWEAKKFKLAEIDIVFTGSEDTMVNGYRSGEFPNAWLPSADVALFKGRPDYHETPVLGDLWYTMNVNIKPFTDVHFRKAIAYAINRVALVNGVDRGTVSQLYCWYPAGILGYRSDCYSRYPHYDPAVAKSELAMAQKDLGTIPPISLEYASENPDRGREAAAVQADLKAVGITMGLKPVPRATWINDGNGGKTPFMVGDWYDDYPDPQDFSDYLLRTGAGENWGRYSNPKVDALFDKGNAASDTATRQRYYQQAQDIIMGQDVPIAMAYQFADQAVFSTKWHGMELNPSFGNEPQPVANDWANVTVTP